MSENDRPAQLFFIVFFSGLCISLVAMYIRYMVLEDYPVFITEELAEEYAHFVLPNAVVIEPEP